MKKNIYPKSQNSVVLSAADSAFWERLLKYTTCGQDRAGGVVPIIQQFRFAQNTTVAKRESTA
jgi:hypothetical protein